MFVYVFALFVCFLVVAYIKGEKHWRFLFRYHTCTLAHFRKVGCVFMCMHVCACVCVCMCVGFLKVYFFHLLIYLF